jgi:RNA polymerase sigma factor (TIGR02999 family)
LLAEVALLLVIASKSPLLPDVTHILQRIQQGDPVAPDELAPLVYAELHRLAVARMARERGSQTLQATALVHEAWMRLGDGVFTSRAHFFGAAASAMRQILVDRARRKLSQKGGGNAEHIDIEEVEIAAPGDNAEEILAVNEALDQLAAVYPEKAQLVKMRYFVGLSFDEIAEIMGISPTSAKREWEYARGWLFRRISAGT